MLSQIFSIFVCLFVLYSVIPPVGASFQGPLDTPATINTLATTSRLMAITRSGNRLIAMGPHGHILLSDDNGQKWQQVAVPVSSNLVAVNFPTPAKGWAVGHEGVILHSGDGGRSWIKQLDGKQAAEIIRSYYHKRIAGGDSKASGVLAEVERLYKEGADKPFLDVWFVTEQEGFVVGAFNMVMHTIDGGKAWDPLIERTDNPTGRHIYAVKGSGREIYIAGETGLLRRWDRNTQRFVAVTSPYGGSYFAMLVKDKTLIICGMRGNAFRSKDGGITWRKLDTKITAGLTGGAFLEDGRAVLVSQGGQVLIISDSSEAVEQVQVVKPMPFYGVAPAGKHGIALVGEKGVITMSLK